jgi:hypothetical protein
MNTLMIEPSKNISLGKKFYLCAAIVIIYDVAYLAILQNLFFAGSTHF